MITYSDECDNATQIKEKVDVKLVSLGITEVPINLYVWGIGENRKEDIAVSSLELEEAMKEKSPDKTIIIRTISGKGNQIGLHKKFRVDDVGITYCADLIVFATIFLIELNKSNLNKEEEE